MKRGPAERTTNPDGRLRWLSAFLLLGAAAMVGRAGYLQLARGGDYASIARSERTARRVVEAPRGVITDRAGTHLATSLERYRIDIAGVQVRYPDSLLRIYRQDIGRDVRRLETALRTKRDFYAHGPFTAMQMRRLRTMDGVYPRPIYRREYPSGPLARPLIGNLWADRNEGRTGLERFLDSLLAGVPGEAVLIKDAGGRTYESPGRVARPAVRGHEVTLTIDRELQEIAEGSLAAVFREANPRRGDIVFLDPRTGEVLAAAAREVDSLGAEVVSASFFGSSFEPGSTAKPFTAAALLALGRVTSTDEVSPEKGVWPVAGRSRPVRDDHPQKNPLTLARAIQVSSNIAMGKFSQRLTPAEHYEALRAFGFASPTGVEFPGEASGVVPRPERWRAGQEGISAAMGYAIQVTPIQLAAAYGALANDGRLMAPALIREIRDPDGKVIYRHQPLVVRQAVTPEVAATIRGYLALSAADSGTGSRAQVRGGVLGKTGTARLVRNGRYVDEHAASFAGIFPANDPQLVVVVRIERPRGGYYGGTVAAPLVGRMLRQALAARRTSLDRTRLADQGAGRQSVAARPSTADREPERRSWVPIPLPPVGREAAPAHEVPDVVGLSVRKATAALHRRGFQVRLEGGGVVQRTVPESGETMDAGKTVMIVAARPRAP